MDGPRRKREALNPDRFKKKARVEMAHKSDRKLVNKLVKEGKTCMPKKPEPAPEQLEWKQTDEGRLEYNHVLPKNDIAAVVMPLQGQSYNPSYAHHQHLLDGIV